MFSQLVSVRLAIGLAAILVLMSSGCSRGSKITKANADKIKIGMSENEVSDLLGNPSESAEVVVPRMGLVFEKAFDGMGPDRVTASMWIRIGTSCSAATSTSVNISGLSGAMCM